MVALPHPYYETTRHMALGALGSWLFFHVEKRLFTTTVSCL